MAPLGAAATGLANVRPAWQNLSGQRQTSSQDPASHRSFCTPGPKSSPHAPKGLGKPEPRRLGLRGRARAPSGRRLVNKEKAGAASESRVGLTQHPKVPAALRGLRPRPGVYGCSSTRASLCPGPDAEKCTASPNPLAHCRLSGTPRDKGDGGDRKVPGAATRR